MLLKKLSIPSSLQCMIQTPGGQPLAFTLQVEKLLRFLGVIFLLFLLCFLGTLFAFREIEINRRLKLALLESQTRAKLLPIPTDRLPQNEVEIEPIKGNSLAPKLGMVSTECTVELCTARIELLPPAPTGQTQGKILVVLETEVPRIGAAQGSVNIRKQYTVYPGFTTRDDFPLNLIADLEKSSYHFTHSLQTTVNFKIPKLFTPLALNIYLFDKEENLIHHVRKPLAGDIYAD